MDRARAVLKLYFDPDMDSLDRAAMLEEFGRALRFYPKWAVSRAFDDWVKNQRRRPSPGEISILATREVERIAAEIKHRKPIEREPDVVRSDDERQRALEMMQRADFTPKRFEQVKARPMARNRDELDAAESAPPKPHWSDTAAPDDPKWNELRRARDQNSLCNPAVKQAAE